MDGKGEKTGFGAGAAAGRDTARSRLAAVYRECYGSLRALVRRYLKLEQDVEDVVQETFMRVSEAQRKSEISELKAYFHATAKNLSLKHLNLHANKITASLEDLGVSEVYDDRPSVDAQYESREQFRILLEAVRDLPPQCRRVLVLRKFYGLSHAEIAARLNISVSTSNQHLAKALGRCTSFMRERGYLCGTNPGSKKSRSDET